MSVTPTKLVPVVLLAVAVSVTGCVDDIHETSTVFTPEERATLAETFVDDFGQDPPSYTDPAGLPAHFARFGFGIADRHLDQEIHLGRALFYDKRLSRDLTVACASCHQQSKGFADDVAFSRGIQSRATARNSPSINNIRAYYGDAGQGFFWDARANSLEEQAEETMGNPAEMGMSLTEVVDRLEGDAAYEILFRKAYGPGAVNESNLTRAIAAFTRSISSTGSKFDHALDAKLGRGNQGFGFGTDLVRGTFDGLTADENAGKELYLDNCASCHSSQLPTRLQPANNGLYATGAYEDRGVGNFTPGRDGWFKTPQLRNVALTAPYMHDGSMATLEEVIEHYSSGIEDHADLSPELRALRRQNSGKRGFNFSAREKTQLLAFLHTLTDYELANNRDLSDPFRS